MPLILDASVAVKLVVEEPGSTAAEQILTRDGERIAPDWILAEVAHALWNKARHQGLSRVQAELGLETLPTYFDRIVPAAPLMRDAIALAFELQHAVYDCLYLALARSEGGTLVTADRAFARAVTNGGMGRFVEPLQ